MLIAVKATMIGGKAWLGQHLLSQAWQQSRLGGRSVKPWPWADVSTIARLEIPSLHRSMIVLSDASGEAMAFGPGLVAGDPLRAANSTLALGGHRDTHLAFLQDLQPGDLISLHSLDGQTFHYRLIDKLIVDSRVQSLQIATDAPGLVLITCFPFDAVQTGGPLRLVARADILPG